MKDQLSELYNRHYLLEHLGNLLKESLQGGQPLAIIYIDIDNFKRTNDYFGFPAGDAVICYVAQTLLQHISRPNWAARSGGEEFVVVLPATSRETAFEVAEAIRLSVSAKPITFQYRGREKAEVLPTTISLGVASLPEDTIKLVPFGNPVHNLLSVAEQAVLMAKQAGRNCTR